jgi:menaquinol-cytochrome c reductase iron-sulfur subunit
MGSIYLISPKIIYFRVFAKDVCETSNLAIKLPEEASMSGSNRISRRDFIKVTTGAIGGVIIAAIGIPVVDYLIDPALKENKAGAPIAIGNLEDIPVGTPFPFSFTITKVNGWERTASSFGGYILRKSEDPNDILILSSRCTHLSCRVNWKEEANTYVCPCHDARFDINGKVIDGPPPAPLSHFAYQVAADGTITILPIEIKGG